jgi:hypothetical protein
MEDNNRFSILILEKDVMEYNYYKTKFNEYSEKAKSRWYYFSRSKNEKLKMEFYTKYIAKMRYLETHYRTNNIYTEYHRQLENQPIHHTEAQHAEPIIATLVEPSVPSLPDPPSDIFRSLNYNNN